MSLIFKGKAAQILRDTTPEILYAGWRNATDLQMNGDIYYFTETGEWWMATDNILVNNDVLVAHPDAMRITNAYAVLDPAFIAILCGGEVHGRNKRQFP
jgi:hypothetical protein